MGEDARQECEEYFRRNGVPHLIADYDPREDTLTRLRPALVVIFVVGLAIGLRPDWPAGYRALAVLAGLAIAAGAIVLANLARGRRWSARPERVGFVEVGVLVLAPPVAALVLGDGWGAALLIGSVSVAVALVLYVAASFGILPILVHQAGAAMRGALTSVSVAIRAMAVMLALLLFLALSQETWRALGILEGWRFGTVLGLFALLAAVMILGGLRRERAALVEPRIGPELAALAETTPAAPLVAAATPGATPRLGRLERLNLTLTLLVALGLRVLAVGVAVGVGFLVFAVLIVDRQLTAEWIGEAPVVYASLDVAGGQLVLSEAAIRVATLLGGFAAVYFTTVAVGDPSSREEFLGDELDRMRHTMAAWAYYEEAGEPAADASPRGQVHRRAAD